MDPKASRVMLLLWICHAYGSVISTFLPTANLSNPLSNQAPSLGLPFPAEESLRNVGISVSRAKVQGSALEVMTILIRIVNRVWLEARQAYWDYDQPFFIQPDLYLVVGPVGRVISQDIAWFMVYIIASLFKHNREDQQATWSLGQSYFFSDMRTNKRLATICFMHGATSTVADATNSTESSTRKKPNSSFSLPVNASSINGASEVTLNAQPWQITNIDLDLTVQYTGQTLGIWSSLFLVLEIYRKYLWPCASQQPIRSSLPKGTSITTDRVSTGAIMSLDILAFDQLGQPVTFAYITKAFLVLLVKGSLKQMRTMEARAKVKGAGEAFAELMLNVIPPLEKGGEGEGWLDEMPPVEEMDDGGDDTGGAGVSLPIETA